MSESSCMSLSVSTGIDGLDAILDGLRIGDNVVWRVESVEDYRGFVTPFVKAALEADRNIIYLRFGLHEPLVAPGPNVRIENLDALQGFEAFTRHAWQQIELWGRGAFYVFDCLTDLLSAWATDHMVGNFFRVICPLLFELDTVAYFALHTPHHSRETVSWIRKTTQVMLDIHRVHSEIFVQPVKVWQRSSPTMFLPHRQVDGVFIPLADSADATRLQASLEQHRRSGSQKLIDYWDRLFLSAQEAMATGDADAVQIIRDRILRVLIGRDERMLDLARRFMGLPDLLTIHSSMIGSGYIGGKAAGMLMARAILLQKDPDIWQEHLLAHDSCYIGSDVYYAFLVHNGLWFLFMRQRSSGRYFQHAEALREAMLAGSIPDAISSELERLLDHFGQYPILVRSSSLLEDGFGNAFAGKYESVFLVNQGSPEERLAALQAAIKTVYASTMSEDVLTYRQGRGLEEQEEPMALLLQRVNGRYHGHYYLPDAAGVGVSRNTFAWDPVMDPAAGMLRLVVGLGTRAVDRIEGDHACVLALDYPLKRPFRSRDESYRFSQHQADLLDINANRLVSVSIQTLASVMPEWPLRWFAEPDIDAMDRMNSDPQKIWRITFAPLLANRNFIDLAGGLLRTLEAAYAHPVDVEFTLHFAPDGIPDFNLVQCRPLATLGEQSRIPMPEMIPPDQVFFAVRGHFMGGNMELMITRVIMVEAKHYVLLRPAQRYALARLVGRVNRSDRTATTLLLGPGRWGTSSPELGVPVRFQDISEIDMLVEVADMGLGMVPDLSFGSHFFQDLVESRIGYVAIFPDEIETTYRSDWLVSNACRCDEELRTIADEEDTETVACLSLWRLPPGRLRLVADVVDQRLVCFGQSGNQ